jgi:hypothetical protein
MQSNSKKKRRPQETCLINTSGNYQASSSTTISLRRVLIALFVSSGVVFALLFLFYFWRSWNVANAKWIENDNLDKHHCGDSSDYLRTLAPLCLETREENLNGVFGLAISDFIETTRSILSSWIFTPLFYVFSSSGAFLFLNIAFQWIFSRYSFSTSSFLVPPSSPFSK